MQRRPRTVAQTFDTSVAIPRKPLVAGLPAYAEAPAYQRKRLVPLLNRYWLHNLASTHNAKKLFNMDISGGLPAVLIKMLAASDPGVIRLFPALPSAWHSGTIEGILCRGQIGIARLSWSGKTVQIVLKSGKAQTISLLLPGEIKTIAVTKGGASIQNANDVRARWLSLPVGRDVLVDIGLK